MYTNKNPNQHFRISEGSCDTEDWSNDAENSALDTKYLKSSFAKKITVFNNYQKLCFFIM